MPDTISFDDSWALPFLRREEIRQMQSQVSLAHNLLHQKTGAGNTYTGWLDWPWDYDKEEYARIKQVAQRIIAQSEVFLVIGIGGSYLGAKAALEMLTPSFYNQLSAAQRKTPQIYFLGQQLSSPYLADLLESLEGKEISVNVISKSGTTTEPAVSFRIIREYMEQRYGKSGAGERIFATTDRKRGALKQLAGEEGYESFVIPDDIGGRYSVLTAVGLLPMAVAGIEIDEIMAGAQEGHRFYAQPMLEENPCYQYAAIRNLLYRKGKTTELLVSYEPSLQYFAEWWKQLFGESEGKDQKGIFPAAVHFTTDLHSLGQYIQDGLRNLFETVVFAGQSQAELVIPKDENNFDGLNFLAGQSVQFVNQRAMEGTVLAHTDGGVPNLMIRIPQLNAFYFGQMVYFFEKACGISGYLLGVNPFDQPGVEAYKQNMFALLGKPGYEEKKAELEKRIAQFTCQL
ncbi:glucose-6-phosphate isomerase [Desulfosporosinus sp. PR]|uniref:glucose-6-phosphate isomerase n=1 Tax=Candidatus Desulfosporosinus nitrosoreducens TaxID=3401928 RepID=UPI0027F599C8|nr:glucose-6-phosphate isomerase [Desulfosporosinus sp. PR]MDQ7096610.1 glucose-6-phosphate isomerase [Desulfosporosinus sp. PR]